MSNNTIQVHSRKFHVDKEEQIKNVDKEKVNAQMKLLEKINAKTENTHKEIKNKFAAEIRAQSISNNHKKLLDHQSKLNEENYALQSNIQHLNKMEQRYRNIFEVIGQKHSAIQNHYQKLKFGSNNLAYSERDKDHLINTFANKQITDYERKVEEDNQRRQQRRLELLRDMQNSNTAQIKNSLVKKIRQKQANEQNEKLIIMKDIATKYVEEDDEVKRSQLKKKYDFRFYFLCVFIFQVYVCMILFLIFCHTTRQFIQCPLL